MKHLPRCIRQEELTKWKLIPAESKRQMKSAPGDDSFRKISSPSVVGRLYTLFSLMPFLFVIFSSKYDYLRFSVRSDVQRRSVDVERLLPVQITYSCFEPGQTNMIWVSQAVYKPFYAGKKLVSCCTVE